MSVCFSLQAKAKILVVRDVERDDIEFISRTLGCLPIAHVDHMRPEKLGHAKLVEEETVRLLDFSPSELNVSTPLHACCVLTLLSMP